MAPLDRVASIAYLIGFPVTFYVAGILCIQAWMTRPIVLKDPHTGQLHIPRSNLTITGKHTRRHGS